MISNTSSGVGLSMAKLNSDTVMLQVILKTAELLILYIYTQYVYVGSIHGIFGGPQFTKMAVSFEETSTSLTGTGPACMYRETIEFESIQYSFIFVG